MNDVNKQRKLDDAERYLENPDKEIFSEEGMKHTKVVLSDVEDLCLKAQVLAGKQHVQEAVGADAAFDLYWKAQKLLHEVHHAQFAATLLETVLANGRPNLDRDTLKGIFAGLMSMVVESREDLSKLGSSISHLTRNMRQQKESK